MRVGGAVVGAGAGVLRARVRVMVQLMILLLGFRRDWGGVLRRDFRRGDGRGALGDVGVISAARAQRRRRGGSRRRLRNSSSSHVRLRLRLRPRMMDIGRGVGDEVRAGNKVDGSGNLGAFDGARGELGGTLALQRHGRRHLWAFLALGERSSHIGSRHGGEEAGCSSR